MDYHSWCSEVVTAVAEELGIDPILAHIFVGSSYEDRAGLSAEYDGLQLGRHTRDTRQSAIRSINLINRLMHQGIGNSGHDIFWHSTNQR